MRSFGASASLCRSCSAALLAEPRQLASNTRQLHASPFPRVKRRSAYRSITQVELQRIADARAKVAAQTYTDADKQELQLHYTPEQLESIEAGEEAIDATQLAAARERDDFFARTADDPSGFARIQPVIDRKLSYMRGEWDNVNRRTVGRARKMKTEESPNLHEKEWDLFGKELKAENKRMFMQDLDNTYLPDNIKADDPNFQLNSYRPLNHLEKVNAADITGPEVAHEIPMITNDPRVTWETAGIESGSEDESAVAYARLARVTGLTQKDILKHRFKVLVSHGVVNQTRLGKIQSQYVLCVCGDQNGMLGIGEGKAVEQERAMLIAQINSVRNLRPVPRYENRTIFGEVRGKSGAVEVTLSARPPGFGIRCNQHVYEIAKCAGLADLSSKIHRARNPMNIVKAVCKALWDAQRDPEDVARGRGRKLVDVRKVYYAGQV